MMVRTSSCTAVAIVSGGLVCEKYQTVDRVLFPNDWSLAITDSLPHTIVWYVAITNVGVATLVHSSITDVNQDIPCLVHQDLGCLLPEQSTNILLCTLTNFVCAGSSNGFANTIFIVSDPFKL